MNVGEIERLLAEFYEGRTTEEQEEGLREYFATQDVPEYLLTDKKLFLSFREMGRRHVPMGLEEKLNNLIDYQVACEKRTIAPRNPRPQWRKWAVGIAACALLVGLGYGAFHLHRTHPKDTFTDPQEAFLAVQAALIEISAGMNDGITQLAEAKHDATKISDEIIKEFQ